MVSCSPSKRSRWLSTPRCVYHVDLNHWPHGLPTEEPDCMEGTAWDDVQKGWRLKETLDLELEVIEDGLIHAIAARWAAAWLPSVKISKDMQRSLIHEAIIPHKTNKNHQKATGATQCVHFGESSILALCIAKTRSSLLSAVSVPKAA